MIAQSRIHLLGTHAEGTMSTAVRAFEALSVRVQEDASGR